MKSAGHGWCFPAAVSVEVGCGHRWKSDTLLAAAQAVPYRGGSVQQRLWGSAPLRLQLWFHSVPQVSLALMWDDRCCCWPALRSWLWETSRMWERGCPHLHNWAHSVRVPGPPVCPPSCLAHRWAGSSCPPSRWSGALECIHPAWAAWVGMQLWGCQPWWVLPWQ